MTIDLGTQSMQVAIVAAVVAGTLALFNYLVRWFLDRGKAQAQIDRDHAMCRSAAAEVEESLVRKQSTLMADMERMLKEFKSEAESWKCKALQLEKQLGRLERRLDLWEQYLCIRVDCPERLPGPPEEEEVA